MKLPTAIFREYDIRGTVGDQLTPEVGRAIGQAVATLGWERLGRAPRLAVGRDNRPSGPALAHGLLSGIEAAGGHGVDVGELPTPALYFATHVLNVDGGVQVTGSHNPPEFNGFKLVLGGEAVAGPDIQGLRRLIEEGRTPGRPGGGHSEDGSVLPRYRDAIVQRNGPLPRKVKVVVDCGNGVSSLIAVDTLARLGADVVPLFCQSDGTFPNHHPDPSALENLRDLQAAVRRDGGELGIAFDGDGDRIGAVDDQGRPVFGDQLLVLLGRDLARRMGPGHAVIFDVKCSEVLPRELARAGLVPTMWKTGHSLIKQKMKETRAPLAGEMSGHIFFADGYYGFDDAVYVAVRLLDILSRASLGLAEMRDRLPAVVNTPELRFDCSENRKFEVVREVRERLRKAGAEVTDIDGVRVRKPEGWWLLRASNTQAVLVARAESATDEGLARLKRELGAELAKSGVALPDA